MSESFITDISLDPKDVARQALTFDFRQTAEAVKFLDCLLTDVFCKQLLPAAFGGPFERVLSFSVAYERGDEPAAILAAVNDQLFGMPIMIDELLRPITNPPKALTSMVSQVFGKSRQQLATQLCLLAQLVEGNEPLLVRLKVSKPSSVSVQWVLFTAIGKLKLEARTIGELLAECRSAGFDVRRLEAGKESR